MGLQYYEVSAKQNLGIDKLFKDIAKRLPTESTNKKKNTLKQKQLEQKDNASYYSCASCWGNQLCLRGHSVLYGKDIQTA